MKIDTIQITVELLALISEVDEFKGAWRALGTLAPERLVPPYDIGEAYSRWQATGVLALQMLAIWFIAYFALTLSLRRYPKSPKKG